ncbi:hypothetical protein SAMN05421770_101547 [Granulicella rosea]|uniref:Uncharacterized protein n=1 Tax=Granulicella rosea TaxID=474952 RepID=A0A239DLS7_9BACT|nr:hypothetical protein [Granulicella rosea]SNS33470.1 hypothetical protein SAMN05421770_101547 [Granulicella rosea]
MSDADYKMLSAYFEELRLTCTTPEKAFAQLRLEGLIDENGRSRAYSYDLDAEATCP